jgi:hypothetical protein
MNRNRASSPARRYLPTSAGEPSQPNTGSKPAKRTCRETAQPRGVGLLQIAYKTSECRIVSEDIPEGYYDFIANLPERNEEALQREIEKRFLMTVQVEKRVSDVLLLTVKNRNAPGLRRGRGARKAVGGVRGSGR